MMRVVTVGDMRRLEQAAVDSGTSYKALMERAGTAAADEFERRYGQSASHTLILCGNGNNGGDGFVIARRLAANGHRVTVLLVSGEPQTVLAAEMLVMLDVQIARYELPQEPLSAEAFLTHPLFDDVSHVVDAVYGIGFHGALPTVHAMLFDRVRERSCPVLAVDIPSGVYADDGTYDAHTLQADVTVTFTAEKPYVAVPSCRELCGETVVCSVGIDEGVCRTYETSLTMTDDVFVRACLPRRRANGHKGTYGRLLSVCGSYGMAGAALLAGRAALRMGLGLLYMAVPNSIYPITAGALLEAVYHPLPESANGTVAEVSQAVLDSAVNGKDAVLVGCGLSTAEETSSFLRRWVPSVRCPMILDADGLNAFSEHILMLKARTAPTVITPHPAEAARLLGWTVTQVERDRFASVRQLAEKTGAVTVLKGHRTLIATPSGEVFLNPTGCSGLATGGSGDILSGMIASLLAQGVSPCQAACCGVYLHGLASEVTAARLSETAMLPSDLLWDLASLLSQFETRE